MTAPPPVPDRWFPGTHAIAGVLVAFCGSALLLFLFGPIAELIGGSGVTGVRRLFADAEVRNAIYLTVVTATIATALGVVGGTPIAYLLARFQFRGRAILAALLDLPLLIPHPVAGIALLLVLGRESLAGHALLALGIQVVGSPVGVVCAMLFVSAPLYVSAAREAFARVDRRYEAVARTLGDTFPRTLRRITLPLAGRGLLAAAVVMWARAVSEFGAIVILTYNPKVASVLSYDRFTSYGLPEALPVAAILALLALIPLTFLRALKYERSGEVDG